jgi:hypothetical protein
VLAEPDTADDAALMSFSFARSFSSKFMKIRERACWYAASLSSIVGRFFVLLRLYMLPDSDGSTSERSASSLAMDPAVDDPRVLGVLRMMLNLG